MKKTIGVFFGSRNPEHDVSIITGQLIISGLKKLDYNVVAIYLDKQGKWYLGEQFSHLVQFTDPKSSFKVKDTEWHLDLQESQGKFVFKKKGFGGGKCVVDIAFPAFHGQNGEDGTFQGLCELLNIPYVGCDVASSAITMDKVLTKLLYRADNIPGTDFVFFTKSDWNTQKKDIIANIINTLKLPVIVKPARLGSSIGITKAKTEKDLEFAIEVALHYDEKVIVEVCITDLMDLTCAVIGNDSPIPSLLQESVFADDLFSYEDKYLEGGGAQLGNAKNSIVIPGRVDEETTKRIQKIAIQVYKLIGCSGIARVDFLYDTKTKKIYANEVNTLPGTIYHHLWKASGIELDELLTKLIGYAEGKYEKKKQYTHIFKSDLLKYANSVKLKVKGGK
ncbi:MAG: D-alanine--D-alanine ligase [Candidatus Roizmanbacteria bacterium]|nr:D-alanine--D-alanine ligase [Candidatus Roizmanbacteria bacterium]